jgi:hypothetical protein
VCEVLCCDTKLRDVGLLSNCQSKQERFNVKELFFLVKRTVGKSQLGPKRSTAQEQIEMPSRVIKGATHQSINQSEMKLRLKQENTLHFCQLKIAI